MRVNKHITTKERRRYALDHFGGVDFSSSPLLCAPNRSPDAVNWIGDHGINRKRHGWEQVMDTFPSRIQGIIPVDDANLLIFSDNKVYLCTKNNDQWEKGENPIHEIVGSQGIVGGYWKRGGYIYIVGYDRYLCFDITEKKFIDIDPYVPTTTINIGRYLPPSDASQNDIRAVLDAPNLLTPWRKNTLEGAALEGTNNKTRWILDGRIKEGTEVTIDAEVFYTDGSNPNGYYIGNLKITNLAEDGRTYGEKLYRVIEEVREDVGSIQYDAFDGRSAIELKRDTTPPIEGQANITVTFQADVDDRSGYINYCSFGTLFGVGGAQDRLFLSGNPNFPNVVFFSEANDFTYFPDTYTATFGTDAKPVNGFLRLSDSVLAVLKEDEVYYQSGEYRTNYDDAGNIKRITPVFSITAGSINEGVLNPDCCANFDGDNVFVSKNGVFGIEATSNVLTNTRVARERSYAVSARMRGGFTAYNASTIVHGQRLYVSNGKACYVADSAYKYVPEGSESFNYEWWYWDHVPAHLWAEINGELWFGTEDGRVCRFTDGYVDTTYDYTADGETGVFTKDGAFYLTHNDEDGIAKLSKGKRLRIDTDGWTANGESLTDVDLYVQSFGVEIIDGIARQVVRLSRYKDAEEGEDLIYSENALNTVLRVYDDQPVVAEWTSPPLDLGNDSVVKTLFSLTVTAETGMNSVLAFGYETRKNAAEMMAEGLGVFSFDDMSFAAFSFENGFQSSYTVRARDRNFNFIRFRFRSDGDRACAVHRISAIYKINKYSKGVM